MTKRDTDILLIRLTDWWLERLAVEKVHNDMHPHTQLLKEAIDWIEAEARTIQE